MLEAEFKESLFNIKGTGLNGEYFVYNSASGALAVFKEGYSLLNNPDDLDRLIDQGFVIDSNEDEIQRVISAREKAICTPSSVQVFEIAPTLKCQASCVYCFQNALAEKPTMSKAIADDTVAFIKESIESCLPEKVHLVWFGGEPLLALPQVLHIGSSIRSYCEARRLNFTSRLVTNGLLLDRDTVNLLNNECNLEEIQVSIDGTNDYYAKNKGVDGYERVVTNISAVCDIIRVIVRVNTTWDNAGHVEELMHDLLITRKLDGKITVYLAQIEDAEGCDDINSLVLSKEDYYDKRTQILERGIGKYRSLDVRQLIPKVRQCNCPLERRHNVMIGPEGDLYDCEESLGFKSLSFSTIYDGLGYLNECRTSASPIPDTCLDPICPLLPACYGGCAIKRKQHSQCMGSDKEVERRCRELSIAVSNLCSQDSDRR